MITGPQRIDNKVLLHGNQEFLEDCMKLTCISNYNKSIMKLTKNKKVDGRAEPLTRNGVCICKHREDSPLGLVL